jgi:hypothetical protein
MIMVYNNFEGMNKFIDKKNLSKLTGLRKKYEEYKFNYMYNGGLESDTILLSFEEWKEYNEE